MQSTQNPMLGQKQITRQFGLTSAHVKAAVIAGKLPEGLLVGKRLRVWPADQVARLVNRQTTPAAQTV